MTRIGLILCATFAVAPISAAPWPFDMRVERCRAVRGGFEVTTTGAVYRLRVAEGEIAFSQRIGARRSLGSVSLDPAALAGLAVEATDPERATFRTATGLRLEVSKDSVLRIDAPKTVRVSVTGTFRPEYYRNRAGAALALDDRGGIGVYFCEAHPEIAEESRKPNAFTLASDLKVERTFLLCVCPPRQYNWKQDHEERIVHFFPGIPGPRPEGISDRPLPTDEELVAWRKVANVLVLHLEMWDGFGVKRIKPKDPVRFRQVIDRAHQLGFLVLPYSSCFYYRPAAESSRHGMPAWRKDAVDLYLEEAKWLLDEYGVDGLYWDGTFTDPLKAWECARRTRDLLGSRRLYVHCTWDPLTREGVFCPFADTYCDYILRGEGRARDTVVDPFYLRYQVSGYNISNTIGTLCYELCRVDRDMFRWALEANARIPYWPGSQVVEGKSYFLTPEEMQLYREFYLPALDRIRGPRDYAPYAAAGLRTRQKRQTELDALRKEREAALARHLAARKAKADPLNLALLKPARCSEYCDRGDGMHRLGLRPEYANDGDPLTFWGADFAPQWVEVDLGTAQALSSVRVIGYYGDKRFYHYEVRTSVDGKEWETVARKEDSSLSTESGDLHRFEPRQARYVRVVMLHNSANIGVHVAELQAYR